LVPVEIFVERFGVKIFTNFQHPIQQKSV